MRARVTGAGAGTDTGCVGVEGAAVVGVETGVVEGVATGVEVEDVGVCIGGVEGAGFGGAGVCGGVLATVKW